MGYFGTFHISISDECQNGLFYKTESLPRCCLHANEDIKLCQYVSGRSRQLYQMKSKDKFSQTWMKYKWKQQI